MNSRLTTRRNHMIEKDKEVKTRLVFETESNRYIWESPYVDVTMDDILDAMFGMLVSATWLPETVIKCMRDYAEERSYMLKENEQDNCSGEDEPQPHFYA